MRSLFLRLRLMATLLTARRFIVFIPTYSRITMVIRGPIAPISWQAICAAAMAEHGEAIAAADARLLAAIIAEDARCSDIEDQINDILND